MVLEGGCILTFENFMALSFLLLLVKAVVFEAD
jgi:hypothetical protein